MHVHIISSLRSSARPESESGDARFALASLDISTGELLATIVGGSDLAGELARLAPREVLIGDDQAGDPSLRAVIHEAGAALTPMPRAHFDSIARRARTESEARRGRARRLWRLHDERSSPRLPVSSRMSRSPKSAARRLMRPPRKEAPAACSSSMLRPRANLELMRSKPGRPRGSLLCRHRPHRDRRRSARAGEPPRQSAHRCDHHQCAARRRRLSRREPRLRQTLREELKSAPDLARALARLRWTAAVRAILARFATRSHRHGRLPRSLPARLISDLPSELDAIATSLEGGARRDRAELCDRARRRACR